MNPDRQGKRLTGSRRRTAVVAVVVLSAFAGIFLMRSGTPAITPAFWSTPAGEVREKSWQAVAPGRVEPCSGQIKVAAGATGVVDNVLVKVNDKVFAGEALIHLADDELKARLAAAETQVSMRERARDEKSATGGAKTRRNAEDAVADAARALEKARSQVDRAATKFRGSGGSNADLVAARLALIRAQNELSTRQGQLRAIEDDSPLPTALEGQLTVARSEYDAARSALDKMILRAPIDGTVLEVSVRLGEGVSPNSPQPPVQLADLSSLCVRAELDERDIASVKVRQAVVVRAAAFPGREFEGTVSSIAPLVEPGRLEPPGSRDQANVEVVRVLIELGGSAELAPGMKTDVYFRAGEVSAGR
jgi:HlyD family secretion protein